jgi:hypothetical protein
MAILTTFTPNTTAKASEVNQNFTNVNAQINPEHNIDGTHSIINYTAIKQNIITVTDDTTITFNGNLSNIFSVTLGGNRTLAVSNMKIGQCFIVRLIQDGSGNRTVTFFGTIKFPAGVTPVLTTTGNKTDVFGFICTGSGTFDGFIVGQNL